MKTYDCPQCGQKLTPNADQRIKCSVCGWGGFDGVDVKSHKKGFAGYIANKSARWRIVAISAVVIAVLVVPSAIMYPVNQYRADKALAKAQGQMDKRLYASAAKTLHQAPKSLVPSSQVSKVKKQLVNNVRWARDMGNVKTAKTAMVSDDPESALDELSDLEEDFPHDDETLELVDLAQEEVLDEGLDVNEEELNEIAFTPDDPEEDALDDIEGDEGIENTPASSNPTTAPGASPEEEPSDFGDDVCENIDGAQTALPAGMEFDEFEIECYPIGTAPKVSEDDGDSGDLEDNPADLSDSPATGTGPKKVDFYHMYKGDTEDHFHTIDFINEYKAGLDKKANVTGFGQYGSIGKLSNKKVTKYPKQIIPLYRYFSQRRQDHYFTTSPSFDGGHAAANYQRQLTSGYIGKYSKSQQKCLAGVKPLYGVYQRSNQTNYITTDLAEKEGLVRNQGFENRGIIGCVW